MNQQILIAMSDVEPIYSYHGINFFNICHVFQALEDAGLQSWKDDYSFRMGQIDEAAEILDAVIYEYARWEQNDSEGIALALRNCKRAVILHDLS
jgi:hypothetical protein